MLHHQDVCMCVYPRYSLLSVCMCKSFDLCLLISFVYVTGSMESLSSGKFLPHYSFASYMNIVFLFTRYCSLCDKFMIFYTIKQYFFDWLRKSKRKEYEYCKAGYLNLFCLIYDISLLYYLIIIRLHLINSKIEFFNNQNYLEIAFKSVYFFMCSS